MSLYQNIKNAQLEARKARDQVSIGLLTTLLGEAAMPGKNDGNRESTDLEVVAVIKKFVKNNESIPVSARSEVHDTELKLLGQWLPKQLSEAELKGLIAASASIVIGGSKPSMGELMQSLKDNFAGQYNGALASKLIKEELSSKASLN